MQTRRHYLRAVCGLGAASLVGLAGCTESRPGGDGDGNGGDDGTDTADTPPGGGTDTGDAGGTRPDGTGGPGVSIVATDADVSLPVEPTVEVVREAATEASPPRLRTTLANTSDAAVRVGEGRAMHFEYVADDTRALQLLPPDREYPAEPDCWRLTESIATSEEYRTVEIPGGERSSRAVDLYATPGEDACLPVGEYRFETTVAVVSADAEPEASARWGFTVVLE